MPLFYAPNQLLNGPASATLDTNGGLTSSIFTGTIGIFTTLTGTTVSGTNVLFATGTFAVLSATLVSEFTGTFVTLTGTTVTGTNALFTNISGSVLASGSTASRTLSKRFADVVNVRDFGAVGDGVTDDTIAFNSSTAAASASGGVVFAPEGTYIVTGVELFQGVTIMGAGRNATIVKCKPFFTPADDVTDGTGHAFGGIPIFYSTYQGNPGVTDAIGIRDLTIDGNGSNQAAASSSWGVYLNGIKRARIENVTAQNMLVHGITLKESVGSIVSNCYALDNGINPTIKGDGIDIISRCTDNLVIDCYASGNTGEAFEDEGRFGSYLEVNRNTRTRWVNCTSDSNSGDGFLQLFTNGSQVVDCTSINDARVGVNSAGIKMIGTRDCLVDNIRVTGSNFHGVWASPEAFGADTGTNTNLVVRGFSSIDSDQMGARIEDCQGLKISGFIRGCVDHGLSFISTASRDIDVAVRVDCTTGSVPKYGIYASGVTRFNVHDSQVRGASIYGLWFDGGANQVSGVLVCGNAFIDNGNSGIRFDTGIVSGSNNFVYGNDLNGNATSSIPNLPSTVLAWGNLGDTRSQFTGTLSGSTATITAVTGTTITGTTALFQNITGSNFVAANAGGFTLTASLTAGSAGTDFAFNTAVSRSAGLCFDFDNGPGADLLHLDHAGNLSASGDVSGTTAHFTTGTLSTVSATLATCQSGTFQFLTGTSLSGTTAVFTTITGTNLTGTTHLGQTGSFVVLTGTTVSGTTATFTTVTGTSLTGTSLLGASGTFQAVYGPAGALAVQGAGLTSVVVNISGVLGIGVNPGSTLDVSGTGAAHPGPAHVQARIYDATAMAQDVGGAISLAGFQDTAGGVANFAAVKGGKANATASDVSGYMVFYTRNGVGNLTERMRVDPTGNVGIGLSPAAGNGLLQVSGTVSGTTATFTTVTGTTISGSTLQLAGTASIQGLAAITGNLTVSGTTVSTGSITTRGQFTGDTYSTLNAVSLAARGVVADGATAVGVKLGNFNTLATAGAVCVGFHNDNNVTRQAAITLSGTLSGSYAQSLTVGAAVTLNAATGRFVVATGTTSFVLTDNAITAQSIIHVIPETSSTTTGSPVRWAIPTLGTGTIGFTSSSANITCSFQVVNGF